MYKTIDIDFVYEGKGQNIYVLDDKRWKYLGQKTASLIEDIAEQLSDFNPPSEIIEAIEQREKRPNEMFLVINSLGSFETWGLNDKGDGFLREDLIKDHKTYETFGRIYYRHARFGHSRPFGKVIRAAMHPTLDLVVLFAILFKDEAYAEALELLARREMAGTSMGTRIEYDVCTICGHKAPTVDQHCDHVKYHLLEVLPGPYKYDPQVGMLNKGNQFRDISLTPIPAWKASSVIAKVAEKGFVMFENRVKSGEIMDIENKEASFVNMAEMDKNVIINPPVNTWYIDKPELALTATQPDFKIEKLLLMPPAETIDFYDSFAGIPTIREVAAILAFNDGNLEAIESIENGTMDWVREQVNKINFRSFVNRLFEQTYNPRYYKEGFTQEELAGHSIWGPAVIQRVIDIINTPPAVIDKTIEGYLNNMNNINHIADKFADSDKHHINLGAAALLALNLYALRRYMMLPSYLKLGVKYGLPIALGLYAFGGPMLDIAKSLFSKKDYYDNYGQYNPMIPPSPIYNEKMSEQEKVAGIVHYFLPPLGFYWYSNYKYAKFLKGEGGKPSNLEIWSLKNPMGTMVLGTVATATTHDILKGLVRKALKKAEIDSRYFVERFKEDPIGILKSIPEENRGIFLHEVLNHHLK